MKELSGDEPRNDALGRFSGEIVNVCGQATVSRPSASLIIIREVYLGYPLVMDSAFGSLEDEYREKVAKWIPTVAAAPAT